MTHLVLPMHHYVVSTRLVSFADKKPLTTQAPVMPNTSRAAAAMYATWSAGALFACFCAPVSFCSRTVPPVCGLWSTCKCLLVYVGMLRPASLLQLQPLSKRRLLLSRRSLLSRRCLSALWYQIKLPRSLMQVAVLFFTCLPCTCSSICWLFDGCLVAISQL